MDGPKNQEGLAREQGIIQAQAPDRGSRAHRKPQLTKRAAGGASRRLAQRASSDNGRAFKTERIRLNGSALSGLANAAASPSLLGRKRFRGPCLPGGVAVDDYPVAGAWLANVHEGASRVKLHLHNPHFAIHGHPNALLPGDPLAGFE